MQFVTAFGIMQDVDWYGMFRSFYETVRVKIKCRDHTRIPASRIFEVNGVLFQIHFAVEGLASVVNVEDEDPDNIHPPNPDEHNDQHEDQPPEAKKGSDKMDTDASIG